MIVSFPLEYNYLLKRTVDPAQATASLIAALPASLQSLALSNPTSAAAAISSELVSNPTSLPGWFQSLPAEVQTYFITQGAAAASATRTPSQTTRAASFSPSTFTTVLGPSSSAIVLAYTNSDGSPTTETRFLQGQSTQTSTVSQNPQHHGLSGGSKAGIAIGVVGGLAVILLCAFLLFRRLKGSRAGKSSIDNTGGDGTNLPETVPEKDGRTLFELPVQKSKEQAKVAELSGETRAPANPSDRTANANELPADAHPPVELSGTSQPGRAAELNASSLAPNATGLPGGSIEEHGVATTTTTSPTADAHQTARAAEVSPVTTDQGARDPQDVSQPQLPVPVTEATSGQQHMPNTVDVSSTTRNGPTGDAGAAHQDELARLREEQARLQEKKKRLQELEDIAEQEERIRRRLLEING